MPGLVPISIFQDPDILQVLLMHRPSASPRPPPTLQSSRFCAHSQPDRHQHVQWLADEHTLMTLSTGIRRYEEDSDMLKILLMRMPTISITDTPVFLLLCPYTHQAVHWLLEAC